MKRPDEVKLSREEGEALIERLEGDALSADGRRVLVQVLQVYFWLLFAVREAKFSLKRLRAMLFGDKPKKCKEPPPDTSLDSRDDDGRSGGVGARALLSGGALLSAGGVSSDGRGAGARCDAVGSHRGVSGLCLPGL